MQTSSVPSRHRLRIPLSNPSSSPKRLRRTSATARRRRSSSRPRLSPQLNPPRQLRRLASVSETKSVDKVSADPREVAVVAVADVVVTDPALPVVDVAVTDPALAETRRAVRDPRLRDVAADVEIAVDVAVEETVPVMTALPSRSKVVMARDPLPTTVVTVRFTDSRASLVKSGIPWIASLELALVRRTKERAVTDPEATAKTRMTTSPLRRLRRPRLRLRKKKRRRRPKLPPPRRPSRRRPRPSPSPRKKTRRLSPESTSLTGRPSVRVRGRAVSSLSSRPVSTLPTPRIVSLRTLR